MSEGMFAWNKAIQQLEENRKNKIKIKDTSSDEKEEIKYGTSVQIGVEGGAFFENLIIVRKSGRTVVAQYSGKSLPRVEFDKGNYVSERVKVNHVTENIAISIEDAIDTWNHYSHYHIPAYNFLMVYCLTKGVDLVDMAIIDL